MAGADFIRDAVFIYNTPLPDVVASIRMVALVPGRSIGLRVLHFGPGMAANAFLDRHRPTALILTKVFDHSVMELAEAAVARRIPLITTLCDLHFSGESGRRNRRLCDLSQAVVVQTAPMAGEVMRQFGKHCAVIEEAIDPICNMTVEIATAKFTTERDGRRYYSCCAHCLRTFEKAHVA